MSISLIKLSQLPRVVSWIAEALASHVEALFLNRFEGHHPDYCWTLYYSVSMGPFLLFCSEDDDLAPYHVVCNFAYCLEELGGDVKRLRWSSSPHVGVPLKSLPSSQAEKVIHG